MDIQPYTTLSAGELETKIAPLNWITENLFIEAGAGILGGSPKSCKSFFALDLCVAIASGTPCAGYFRTLIQGPVTILCAEDPIAVVSSRLAALAATREKTLQELPIKVIVEPTVRFPEGIDRLAATLAENHPRLLLLDPLIRLHRADENSASEMSVILDGLRNLARQSKTAILLVHHARKATSGNAGNGLRGSSDLAAFGDSNLFLRRLQQDDVLELKIEHRAAAPPKPLKIKLVVNQSESKTTAKFVTTDQTVIEEDPIGIRIVELLLSANQPLPSSVLREKLGVRNQTVAHTLEQLVINGRITRSGRDGWRVTRNYSPPSSLL